MIKSLYSSPCVPTTQCSGVAEEEAMFDLDIHPSLELLIAFYPGQIPGLERQPDLRRPSVCRTDFPGDGCNYPWKVQEDIKNLGKPGR